MRSKSDNLKAARLMIGHSIATAKSTAYPVFVFSSEKQQGHDFGSRLAHAYSSVFDLGYEKVIAIGNDCPALDRTVINRAVQQLDHHDLVAGPTKDGGVYLLGLQRSTFDAAAFMTLPWQSSALFQVLNAACTQGTVLPMLMDIDDATSLWEVIAAARSRWLPLQLVLALWHLLEKNNILIRPFPRQKQLLASGNPLKQRPPPMMAV